MFLYRTGDGATNMVAGYSSVFSLIRMR